MQHKGYKDIGMMAVSRMLSRTEDCFCLTS